MDLLWLYFFIREESESTKNRIDSKRNRNRVEYLKEAICTTLDLAKYVLTTYLFLACYSSVTSYGTTMDTEAMITYRLQMVFYMKLGLQLTYFSRQYASLRGCYRDQTPAKGLGLVLVAKA